MAEEKEKAKAVSEEPETVTVHYMGGDYEVDKTALLSMRYQRMLASGAKGDMAAMFDAMDAIMCGRLDEYAGSIPEEDGSRCAYGASMDAMGAFLAAATEQATAAKN